MYNLSIITMRLPKQGYIPANPPYHMPATDIPDSGCSRVHTYTELNFNQINS